MRQGLQDAVERDVFDRQQDEEERDDEADDEERHVDDSGERLFALVPGDDNTAWLLVSVLVSPLVTASMS